MKEGIVIKSTGSWYLVQMDPDTILECRIIGKFRLDGLKLTNPVAVGDRVLVEPDAELGSGVIRQIQPRQNYVVRQSPRRKHDLHLLASNIDQAVVVVTIVHPNLKQGFIDRFLLMTEPYDIPVTVVFNKCDLYEAHDMEMFEYIKSIYVSIGYQVLLASATHSDGLDDLRMLLKDKTTLVSGQSGVGKSTLINAIQPQLDLRTGEISDYSGKGQHTTTFAQMYNLDFGGAIIDTPGIKTLAFNHLEPMDVAHNFREFFALSDDCRFGGKCLHRNEPGCAVKAAIAEGQVSELRYANYLTIIEEIEDINYWERNNQY
ncbi:MAG: ribosome small subunit-dependent GTPase A [Saprospiraceae bacterium]|nr:ribosome small subunit-dependent GTPase A [Saprospiraceae bacterium]MDP4821224.1 ribosome small subunit-dependent GTPase A [Saprospiraceae bacterium]MDP4998130.1 ribosome small subunit-dependent GTPase A [Saprospiraceae bacterium]